MTKTFEKCFTEIQQYLLDKFAVVLASEDVIKISEMLEDLEVDSFNVGADFRGKSIQEDLRHLLEL